MNYKICNFETKILILNLNPVTITSDFGTRDFYAAVVNGRLLSLQPALNIVTVTHQIRQYDVFQASVIVRNMWSSFPDGTVHLVLVNGTSGNQDRQVAIKYKNHFFVGPDNGLHGLVFDENPEVIVQLDQESIEQDTFPELDICTKAAVHLAEGKDILELGTKTNSLLESMPFRPTSDNNTIKGMVIYIDNYHNAITNITKKVFDKMNKNNKYIIRFGKYYTQKISPTYHYAPEAELVAVFGSTGLLEIALYQTSARELLGIQVNDVVRIEFE